MADPPTGTVTFLFTDIEGSTRLWEQHPEAMAAALARHDALATALIDARGGALVKQRGEGDSLFAVFPRSADAVAGAAELQRALCSEPWPPETPLRVRIALHTGAALLRDGDYYGAAVNRCARLRAVAHGGQVLLSQATCDLAREQMPPGASLRDLGLHRLRDLQQPERIFQLLHPELPAEFPPLRSLEAFSHNLPVQLTRFIGREREMAEVKRLLASTHLLTLTGSGGCGKTRLALQVAVELAERFADGVWLVELAALTDAALVPHAVASALGLREEPGRSLTATLTEFLRPKSLLLVLDNCEHLLLACAQLVDTLLRACPKLRILASSREGLGIAGEQGYRVPSLALPDPKQWLMVDGQWLMSTDPSSPHQPSTINHQPWALMHSEAVQLFIDRAQAAVPDFTLQDENAPAVAQVCHRLDGIPLAIELAAARVKVLPPAKINERLDDRFRLLTGGSRTALPRQQTLQATVDWSYELLSEAERTLLRRLSVFAGGFTLEAAEAVCSDFGFRISDFGFDGNDQRATDDAAPPQIRNPKSEIRNEEVLDLLSSLVDKSLVLTVDQAGEARYRLLETIREYGHGKLDGATETEVLHGHHRDWFLRLAETAGAEWMGPAQGEWLARLETEHDNLRAALTRSVAREEAQAGLRLAGALRRFWEVRGYWAEGRQRLAEVLALPKAAERTGARASALLGAGTLAELHGDYKAGRLLFEESLAIYRELGDNHGISMSLNNLGAVAQKQGDYAAARAFFEENLAVRRQMAGNRDVAQSSINLGALAMEQGDYAAARAHYEESLAIARERGHRLHMAISLNGLGSVATYLGERAAARARFEESLVIHRELGNKRGIGNVLNNMGLALMQEREHAAARALFEESLAVKRELGERSGIAVSLESLGMVAREQGDFAAAAKSLAESLAILVELGDRRNAADALDGLAAVAIGREQWERAARLFGAAAALREAVGAPLPPSDRVQVEAWIAEARAALGAELFAAAWAEGRSMTLEAATAYALEDDAP